MLNKYFNNKQIKKYTKDIKSINSIYEKNKTNTIPFNERLKEIRESNLNRKNKIHNAIAIAKHASEKSLGMSYYDVQIMGALALIEGKIAQMKTGEGKTLMCSAAATANFALGYKTHVATANEYLAQRDEETLHPLYEALGLKSTYNIASMSHDAKKSAYDSDILYSTSQEMGFDYLRDNLVKNIEEKIQPQYFPQVVAIIDEADFILIDEARTPLIISGSSQPQGESFYHTIKDIADKLEQMAYEPKKELGHYDIAPGDFWIEHKTRTIYLSDPGYSKLEVALKEHSLLQNNLYSRDNLWLVDEVINALKAKFLYIRDKQYVVQDGEVVIVDENTGRLSVGRSWSDGLHQAIEAKEGLVINSMTSTLRTVSIQNYFRHYGKISGMTGTAVQCREEFDEIYNCSVVEIPTNRKMVRIDHADKVFIESQYKYSAIVNDIAQRHEKGQPILVGTTSVNESEIISSLLTQKNIFHYVLNAKNHALEAQIISQAGIAGAVTVATSMAGRGTDIILGGNKEEIIKIKNTQIQALGFLNHAITSHIEKNDEIEEVNENYSEIGFNNLVDIQFFIDNLYNEGLEKPISLLKNNLSNISKLTKILSDEINEIEENWKNNRQKAIHAGGLAVIGCSRNESRRIDDQIRGRAGRQGDVGESVFYISFEDNWLQVFAKSSMFNILRNNMEPDLPITSKFVSSSIEKAQRSIENMYFDSRKNTFQYDSILNESRVNFFRIRDSMISSHETIKTILLDKVKENVKNIDSLEYVLTQEVIIDDRAFGISEAIDKVLDVNLNFDLRKRFIIAILQNLFKLSPENALKLLTIVELKQFWQKIESKEIQTDEDFRAIIEQSLMDYFTVMQDDFWNWFKSQCLEDFDNIWIEYLAITEEIRNSSGFSTLIQKNPIYEYKKACYELFKNMIEHFTATMLNEMLQKTQFTLQQEEI